MLKRVPRRPVWVCPSCARRQRRFQSVTATATASTQHDHAAHLFPVDHNPSDANRDDEVLRKIFDSQSFWREFSRSTVAKATKPAGLFRNAYLVRPQGWQTFAQRTLEKCQRIVRKVVNAKSVEEHKAIARDLDRLSDLLCRVIDLSDFVRSTHPDKNMQMAATHAYAMMFEYMNTLNTMTELHDRLREASAMPEVWKSWTEEEQVVANILMKDFSKSAIDLPEGSRQLFVELSNDITHTGTEFVDNMAAEKSYLSIESGRMKGMDPVLAKSLTRWGKITLPTVGMPATMALRTVEDTDVRREIYMASRTSSTSSVERLETLLRKRAELAKLSGYETFAHMALSDKMAQTPEAVNQFLQALAADNHGLVRSELKELLELKASDARSGNFPGELNAWDRDYYTTRLLSQLQTRVRSPDFLSAYFSLGTVMQGLSRLFHRLYGIRLVPRETLPGETWYDDVRRLDVIDDHEGYIAVVYCDLFSRYGKSPNPAHFTLRCSRRIPDAEIAEVQQGIYPGEDTLAAATDGMAAAPNPADDGNLYQLPTIALICDFARTSAPSSASSAPGRDPKPTLLSFREVQTLFHEMGHAVHSMLGRTSLQNVSGTRCATDFAELPSVLMEHFASAPEVLALFAEHYETGQKLPFELVKERLMLDSRMQGAETETQILLALLDQSYHGTLPAEDDFDSTKVYHDVWDKHSSVPEPAGTRWQGFFGHLFGYGATYYSYLFDRAIAGKVWKDVFQRTGPHGAVDREAGERFRREVLRWGGSREPWKCVAGLLGDGRLENGGEQAMKEVGRWGVRD